VSLNRTEQLLYDYLLKHADEGQHWKEKVRATLSRHSDDPHSAAVVLESELWHYFRERSQVAAPFREHVKREGLQRMSLRNLAEYLLRLWTVPRPPRSKPENRQS
jgi:hypothetical protein